ncbi:RodZ domain-containing protein [Halomonas sp. hl-4]|uniref:RodZ domain-containing protein n=1 Tax=Halomonas sp. hl-4 TaxID=1761789 RepID=UPI000BB7E831|nr:RodZ domain-containing protein [Halomonas sp. hl-4]SNY97210.1 cytoskeleton protein RodZ [Halomonas sp. hl-4]
MSETPSQASDTPIVNDSPGELLARRREQLGIALNDAARALNLRPAVVEGLERDDYSEIPVVTYRRGYLRAYAKYLAIDEHLILDAYRTRFGEADLERKVTPVAVTKPPSRLGAWLFKLVTLFIIVGLIAVTVMWWQSRGGNELPEMDSSSSMEDAPAEQEDTGELNESSQSDPELSSSESDDVTDEDTALNDSATEDSSAAESNFAAENTAEDTSETGNETPSDSADSALLIDEEGADEATESTSLAETDSQSDGDESNDDATGDDANEGDETTGNDSNTNRLALTFNEQSWTEIIDADNQRVLVGLQEPGTSTEVEGQPPFRLTVGNVTGVELRYQGEDVDLSSRAGANNVARFTLGE